MKKGRNSHADEPAATRDVRNGGHFWLWAAAGILGGLYLVGKQQRPEERQPSVEAIDEPEVTEAWQRLSGLPQFRFMWNYVSRKALLGRRNLRVLDIGSGLGQLSLLMARRPEVTEVTGIDIAEDMVKRARQAAEAHGASNATFLQVDAAEMPFADGAFDLIVSTVSLHHWQQPLQVLREIKRVLAPGGRALIFDLRRDTSPIIWGLATVATRFIVPAPVRDYNEPLASLQASYTPSEAVLMAHKAGWENPHATQGPVWLALELDDLQEAA